MLIWGLGTTNSREWERGCPHPGLTTSVLGAFSFSKRDTRAVPEVRVLVALDHAALEGARQSGQGSRVRLSAPDRPTPRWLLACAGWAEEDIFARLAVKLDSETPGLEALVVDDTGFAKKGKHSVGVQRQYSGRGSKRLVLFPGPPREAELGTPAAQPRR